MVNLGKADCIETESAIFEAARDSLTGITFSRIIKNLDLPWFFE